MVDACRAAAADSGVPDLARFAQRILVPQGSWSLTNPAATLADELGAAGAQSYLCEIGVSQQEVIGVALEAVRDGLADVVLVVGGEARAFARSGGGVDADDPSATPPDVTLTRPPDFVAPIELAAGMVWPPVQQYALIENALGAHENIDPIDDIAQLWARFNTVASSNDLAAFPAPLTAEDIARPGPNNRPLAYPYNLWHSSQWTVDQAAALLICSTERAIQAGVPKDRWIFPHVALHSSHAVTLTARRQLHAWPAMRTLRTASESHLGVPLSSLRIAEVYSCFPSAVRVQQRELGLDLSSTPTVTGGMAFAGGPFNNFVFQSMAAVVGLLRERPGERGLVTTVSGMLSKPGLAIWSASPHKVGALVADLGSETDAATDMVPVADLESAEGPATVVSFTVTYDRAGDPVRVAIVADLGDGSRVAAACEDDVLARHALTSSLIGHEVHVAGATFSP